jgi:hypothetical protein
MDLLMTQAVGALVAIALSSIAGPVLAADMPIGRPLSTPAFSWTSCHLGAHAGGGWARKSITDPAQLVKDAIIGPGTTVGVTTVSPSPSGAVIGGQMGCDYQFMSNWVMGMEGAASGLSMKGSAIVALPAGNPGDQALVGARVDFLSSVTATVLMSDRVNGFTGSLDVNQSVQVVKAGLNFHMGSSR